MLLLSQIEKRELIQRLPKFELSYDTILHKKVSADFYIIIPKGKKVLIWFTYFKNTNRCFMLELDKFKNISGAVSDQTGSLVSKIQNASESFSPPEELGFDQTDEYKQIRDDDDNKMGLEWKRYTTG